MTDHLTGLLPPNWQATLLAEDGAKVESIDLQSQSLPPDTTHIALSVGGNDALELSQPLFSQPSANVAGALLEVAKVRDQFSAQFDEMLKKSRSGFPNTRPNMKTSRQSIPKLGVASFRLGVAVAQSIRYPK